VDFSKAISAVEGAGMRSQTSGRFLGHRRDRCGCFPKRFQQAVVVEGTGMGTQTSGRFLDPRLDLCGFLPSDFSKPSWEKEQVCEHRPPAAFSATVATAVDVCQAISASRRDRRNRYRQADLGPLSRPASLPL